MKTHKFAEIFPLMNEKEYEELKEDIKENGLLDPIILFEEQILDGRNRYNVCEELNIKPKFEDYKGDNALQFVISTNLKRRYLTESQRSICAIKHRQMFDEEAKKRMSLGGKGGEGMELVPPLDKGKARDKLGEVFGITGRYIDMAEVIKEKAPEQIEAIEKGEKKISSVYRKLKIEEQKEEIKKLIPEKELKGIYDVIVIDPPWETKIGEYDEEGARGIAPYPTMSLEQLKQLKLPMTENCIIWIWFPNFILKEIVELSDAWELQRKTILTWDKQIMGVGHFLRNITEHCLLCFKGKPLFINTKWTTLISEKRTTHSTKPEIFYKMVEETCVGRKLNYFGRKRREGWDVYGNEVKNEAK